MSAAMEDRASGPQPKATWNLTSREAEIREGTLNTTQGSELDGVANVLYWLHNVEPLRGCSFDDDERFRSGHYEILRWLERRVRAIGDMDSADEMAAEQVEAQRRAS